MQQASKSFSLAVDIGGTFTDAVLRHNDGRAWIEKSLTTYNDLLVGFFNAVDGVLARGGVRPADVDDVVVHATTVVTNCIIQRRGAKTALLCTKGFSDILRVRTASRTNIFDNQMEVSEPLVPRALTFPVNERIFADGVVEREVDPKEVAEIVAAMRAKGVESVAVCFLHSYKNDHNEQAVSRLLKELAPELFVTISAKVAPQILEYQRTSTTVINAYTLPLTQPYLNDLVRRLEKHGFSQKPLIMLSGGGVVGSDIAGLYPVRMIESGPAAGALAAKHFSAGLGLGDLLAFDMGGTTAKCCFILDGKPFQTGIFEVDRRYRMEAGSGMPVTVPCIDMVEIGTGGGSIAARDSIGLLRVGPDSAGSEPGPVCYGRGGTAPTVTDANLMLGMLDAENFLGGEFKLDLAGASEAMDRLAAKLGVSRDDAAIGIFSIAGDAMAAAIKAHANDHGLDWQKLPILAFGGAGPIHACYVAQILGCNHVIFPPLASVLSAYGALVTPVRIDLVRSEYQQLQAVNWPILRKLFRDMEQEGRAALISGGCNPQDVHFSYSVDLRYLGQPSEITVELSEGFLDRADPHEIRNAYEQQYHRQFGITLPDVEIDVTTWRTQAYGPDRSNAPVSSANVGRPKKAHRRTVQFPGGKENVQVLARPSLKTGDRFTGPLIIEERETTLVIPPGWDVRVDNMSCVIATIDYSKAETHVEERDTEEALAR